MTKTDHQPGDLILNRRMPHATNEEREIARENLRRLARLILRVRIRVEKERIEKQESSNPA